jgi:hypothetical protein
VSAPVPRLPTPKPFTPPRINWAAVTVERICDGDLVHTSTPPPAWRDIEVWQVERLAAEAERWDAMR